MRTCTCPCRLMGAHAKHGCTGVKDDFPKLECWFPPVTKPVIIRPCTPCRKSNLRILVTGSRDGVDDIDRVWSILDLEMSQLCEYNIAPIIVQGGARGVDKMAIEWAKHNGYMVETHRPDYGRYGRHRAPHVRNSQMVKLGAHRVVGIVSGESGGTRSTLEKARDAGLQVHEHKWDE